MTEFQTIIVERDGCVGLITPEPAQGVECPEQSGDARSRRRRNDADPGIGAIVLTGSEKAFAAGADIKGDGRPVVRRRDWFRLLRHPGVNRPPTPTIAAVSGYRWAAAANWR